MSNYSPVGRCSHIATCDVMMDKSKYLYEFVKFMLQFGCLSPCAKDRVMTWCDIFINRFETSHWQIYMIYITFASKCLWWPVHQVHMQSIHWCTIAKFWARPLHSAPFISVSKSNGRFVGVLHTLIVGVLKKLRNKEVKKLEGNLKGQRHWPNSEEVAYIIC